MSEIEKAKKKKWNKKKCKKEISEIKRAARKKKYFLPSHSAYQINRVECERAKEFNRINIGKNALLISISERVNSDICINKKERIQNKIRRL